MSVSRTYSAVARSPWQTPLRGSRTGGFCLADALHNSECIAGLSIAADGLDLDGVRCGLDGEKRVGAGDGLCCEFVLVADDTAAQKRARAGGHILHAVTIGRHRWLQCGPIIVVVVAGENECYSTIDEDGFEQRAQPQQRPLSTVTAKFGGGGID